MPTVQVPAQLSIDHLLAAVKQLSPAERHEFERRLAEWQDQQDQNGMRVEGANRDEAVLLARIEENSRLPAAQQRLFNRLRRKRQSETLTESEEAQLQALWQRVEQMNVAHLEALTRLAQLRSTDVKTLMRELRLPENRDVF